MPSRARPRLPTAIVVVALGGAVAHATPWEPKDGRAKADMKRGAEAFKANDYATAADAFLESWDAEHSLKARWSAAQAHAAAGDWPRASVLLDALVADPTWPKAKRADLEARARVAAAFVSAAAMARDGKFEAAQNAYLAIEADESSGANARSQARAAADALAVKLARDAEERDRAAQVQPPTLPTHTPEATRSAPPPSLEVAHHGPDWLGWSVVGAGAVVALVGAGFVWHAGSLYDQADAEKVQLTNRDLRDRADTQRIGGQLALGVGAAAVIVGAVKLIAFKPTRTSSVSLAPRADGGVLVLGGTF